MNLKLKIKYVKFFLYSNPGNADKTSISPETSSALPAFPNEEGSTPLLYPSSHEETSLPAGLSMLKCFTAASSSAWSSWYCQISMKSDFVYSSFLRIKMHSWSLTKMTNISDLAVHVKSNVDKMGNYTEASCMYLAVVLGENDALRVFQCVIQQLFFLYSQSQYISKKLFPL